MTMVVEKLLLLFIIIIILLFYYYYYYYYYTLHPVCPSDTSLVITHERNTLKTSPKLTETWLAMRT